MRVATSVLAASTWLLSTALAVTLLNKEMANTFNTGGPGTSNPAGQALQIPGQGMQMQMPGVRKGHIGPSFPVYYSYQMCGTTEVQVVFYEKDGCSPSNVNGQAVYVPLPS
ncbi:hypothetical protein B0H67DRAFT_642628 [Lasiosphaeris hirsuta]|uniref:Uncharacterized protein n=1 Tax=Lasiosphaeris hirsuta TaxID=260670 RepID=A0AA40ANU1_9PEZI|nr:hypothetical protein B0H67DRAFT_642628 [Lasiosphaeris hirsuta]